jgi:hypothetical protein
MHFPVMEYRFITLFQLHYSDSYLCTFFMEVVNFKQSNRADRVRKMKQSLTQVPMHLLIIKHNKIGISYVISKINNLKITVCTTCSRRVSQEQSISTHFEHFKAYMLYTFTSKQNNTK